VAKETEAILRSILYTVKSTDDIKKIRSAIQAMCSKEDIDSVDAALAQLKEDN
jgi:hypothetical protein